MVSINPAGNDEIIRSSSIIKNGTDVSSVQLSGNIDMIQHVKLTDKEKSEMLLFGMNPDSSEDIVKYKNMTPEQKEAKFNEINTQLKETKSEPKTDVTDLDFDKILTEKFNIDTTSENWKNKSDENKLKTVIEIGARGDLSQAEWSSMSDLDKNKAKQRFVNNTLKQFIPDWENKSESEQLDKISDIINIYKIAKSNSMSLQEIIKLKQNSPQKFEELKNNYINSGNETVDLSAKKKLFNEELNKGYIEHDNEFAKYCEVNTTSEIKSDEFAIKEYEFLKSKKPAELNKVQKHKLETYKALEKSIGIDNIKELEVGTKHLNTILSEEELSALNLEKNDKGELDPLNDKNIAKIKAAAAKKLFACKNSEELKQLLKGLAPEDFVAVMNEITSKDNNDYLTDEFKKILSEVIGEDKTVALINAHGIITNPKNRSSNAQDVDARTMIPALKKHGIDDKTGLKTQASMAENYEAKHVATAQVTAAENELKEYVEIGNKHIAKRDDALDVFKVVNSAFAQSETISDEMKSFYSQTAVENISPEHRNEFVNDLHSYQSESFNKGIETGYTNIANSQTNNITVNSDSSVLQNNLNINNDYAYNNQSQNQAQNQSWNLTETKDYLQKLTPKEQEEFVKSNNISPKICEEMPNLVGYFVSKGEGMTIVNNCSVPIGNTAIRLMLKSPDERKKLAALHPGRLSKVTYELVNKDKESDINPQNMNTYKA